MRNQCVTPDEELERKITDQRLEQPVTHPIVKHTLDLRKIGGSDAPAILGVDPFGKTAFDIYLRIRERVSTPATPKMKLGKRFEKPIAEWWAEERGALIEWWDVSFEIPNRPWQRITPDLHVLSRKLCNQMLEETAIADVKRYTRPRAFLGTPGTDQVTPYELVQLTTYMEALRVLGWNITKAFLIVHDLEDDELLEYVVNYDPDLAAMIVGELEHFWNTHVLPGVPPPIGGSNNTRLWLEDKYPRARKPERPATDGETGLALRWRELSAQEKAIEEELDVIKNKLRESIGDAEKIKGEWGSLSWSNVEGGPVTYERKPYRKLHPYFRKVRT